MEPLLRLGEHVSKDRARLGQIWKEINVQKILNHIFTLGRSTCQLSSLFFGSLGLNPFKLYYYFTIESE